MPEMRMQTPESAQFLSQLKANDIVRFIDDNVDHVYLGKEQLGKELKHVHMMFAKRNNTPRTSIIVKYIPEINIQVNRDSVEPKENYLFLIDGLSIAYRFAYPDFGPKQHRPYYFTIDAKLKGVGR